MFSLYLLTELELIKLLIGIILIVLQLKYAPDLDAHLVCICDPTKLELDVILHHYFMDMMYIARGSGVYYAIEGCIVSLQYFRTCTLGFEMTCTCT